jgi:hypothetical protein
MKVRYNHSSLALFADVGDTNFAPSTYVSTIDNGSGGKEGIVTRNVSKGNASRTGLRYQSRYGVTELSVGAGGLSFLNPLS